MSVPADERLHDTVVVPESYRKGGNADLNSEIARRLTALGRTFKIGSFAFERDGVRVRTTHRHGSVEMARLNKAIDDVLAEAERLAAFARAIG